MLGLSALAALALPPDFNWGELAPNEALLDKEGAVPFNPPRVAAVILANGLPTDIHTSLVDRWYRATRNRPIDVIVALSVSDEEVLPTYPDGVQASSAEELYQGWVAKVNNPNVPVYLITTETIRRKWPQVNPSPEPLSMVIPPKPFEWAHHEPTFLSVPRIHRYSYIWVCEQDTIYKGNLTRWIDDVHFTNPGADFITYNEVRVSTFWPWSMENWNEYRQMRALHNDLIPALLGHAKHWRSGYEHLRCWSRAFIQVIASYLSQGMYVFGEAMSPSLCYKNSFLDCRTNSTWFNASEVAWKDLGEQPPPLTLQNWSHLGNNQWHNGLAPDWNNVTWPANYP